MKFATALAILATACGVQSQIILSHPNSVIATRLDPLVSPNGVASHVHTVVGGSNFASTFNANSSLASECTTAPIIQDFSNYWTPSLYWQWTNGSFTLLPHGGANTYYLNRPGGDNMVPFPAGFRMIGGDPNRRTFNSSLPTNVAISYVCLGGNYPQGPAFPPANVSCPGGWRMQINMPQCWDGVNLYLSDNSHVSYATAADNGACPASHPKHFISLFYEFFVMTNNEQATLGLNQNTGRYVLSNGDPTGYGFHGDFTNAWNQTLLTNVVNQCFGNSITNPNAGISDCAPLTPYTNNPVGNCQSTGQIVNEPIGDTAPLASLPGCNPVWDGTGSRPTCAASTAPSIGSLSTPGVSTVSNNAAYLGCWSEATNSRALNLASTTGNNMTPDVCTAFCATKNATFAGVEYGRECYCGNSFQPGSTLQAGWGPNSNLLSNYSTSASLQYNWYNNAFVTPQQGALFTQLKSGCNMPCAGNSSTFCGGGNRLGVYALNAAPAVQSASASASVVSSSAVVSSAASPTLSSAAASSAVSSLAPSATPSGPSYLACYTEATSGRALTGASTSSNSMTPAVCNAYCASKGFQYAGVEYGAECYCGNTFNAGSVITTSGCSMACAGNKALTCGGPNRLSVWNSGATKLLGTQQSSGSYTLQGCYPDITYNRLLNAASVANNSMSVDTCVSFCSGKGYSLAGVEYGSQCYCGNNLAYSVSPLTGDPIQAGCNMLCANAASLTYCGGSNRLNIYAAATTVKTNTITKKAKKPKRNVYS